MDVSTISVKPDTAYAKIADIKGLKKSQRTEDDDRLLSLYSAVVKRGARVISLSAAFRQTGLNEEQQPKLAIAQADWKQTWFRRAGGGWQGGNTGGKFWHQSMRWERQNSAGMIRLRTGSFIEQPVDKELSTQVPYVPANVRPRFHLRNYQTLFEVDVWTVHAMSVDPFLLKHIMGDLYIVEAEWDLTPLEAMLLGSMRTGN